MLTETCQAVKGQYVDFPGASNFTSFTLHVLKVQFNQVQYVETVVFFCLVREIDVRIFPLHFVSFVGIYNVMRLIRATLIWGFGTK